MIPQVTEKNKKSVAVHIGLKENLLRIPQYILLSFVIIFKYWDLHFTADFTLWINIGLFLFIWHTKD
jgi:hypothetical protein